MGHPASSSRRIAATPDRQQIDLPVSSPSQHARRFGIHALHTDHYVLLAERLAKHFPWLAEVRYFMPEGEIEGQGFTLMENPAGRIKPFGWAHRTL